MTLSELVAAVYLKSTGKVATFVAGDAKYEKIKAIANGLIDTWQNEYGVDWSSLYDKAFSIGTVTATDSFDLDDDIRKISDTKGDYVQITATGGTVSNYEVVPADALKRYDAGSPVCAQIGRTLVFNSAFDSDSPLIGGTITVPVYLYADTLSAAGDEVPVDIPRWLVLMTAAEYVRNDVTKQNQYPNLVQEANQLMDRMIDDNDAQVNTVSLTPFGSVRTW